MWSEVKVAQSCPTLCDPTDYRVEFSTPEYWSGEPFPSPGDLPNPEIEPGSPVLQADSYHLSHHGNPAAAAAAKSLQSCPTLCDPIDGSLPGSPLPEILQARTLEWVAISFCNAQKWKVKGKSLSCVQFFATPWTAAHQAPPSMGFSRQEYWSGLPFPSPREILMAPKRFYLCPLNLPS